MTPVQRSTATTAAVYTLSDDNTICAEANAAFPTGFIKHLNSGSNAATRADFATTRATAATAANIAAAYADFATTRAKVAKVAAKSISLNASFSPKAAAAAAAAAAATAARAAARDAAAVGNLTLARKFAATAICAYKDTVVACETVREIAAAAKK